LILCIIAEYCKKAVLLSLQNFKRFYGLNLIFCDIFIYYKCEWDRNNIKQNNTSDYNTFLLSKYSLKCPEIYKYLQMSILIKNIEQSNAYSDTQWKNREKKRWKVPALCKQKYVKRCKPWNEHPSEKNL